MENQNGLVRGTRRWWSAPLAAVAGFMVAGGGLTGAAETPAAPAAKPAASEVVAGAPSAATTTPQLISLTLDDVPLAEVVRLFTRISGANIIAATTNLQGQVTANLQDVAWKPAFESILERQNLQLIEKPPASGIYVIDARKTSEDPHVSTTMKLNYAKVADVAALVTSILGKDGSVTPFAAANSIVVNASVIKAAEVRKIIEELDRPRAQVAIETKILQLSEGTSKKLGINWKSLDGYGVTANTRATYSRNVANNPSRQITTTRTYDQFGNEVPTLDHYETITTPSGDISVPIYKPTTTLTDTKDSSVETLRGLSAVLTPSEFSVMLSMLEGSSGTKMVSNPKVIVANEEKAFIKMARDEPNLKTTKTPAAQGSGSGGDTYTTEVDSARPFFTYGITMEVTPRINTASNITVIIKPELSSKVPEETKIVGGNTYPVIEKKSVETIFSLSDGRTAAIGGLIENEDSDVRTKVPMLGDIPWLGEWLFSYKSRVKSQKEILIFVTINIVDPQSNTETMQLPSECVLYPKSIANKVVTPAAATNKVEKTEP